MGRAHFVPNTLKRHPTTEGKRDEMLHQNIERAPNGNACFDLLLLHGITSSCELNKLQRTRRHTNHPAERTRLVTRSACTLHQPRNPLWRANLNNLIHR